MVGYASALATLQTPSLAGTLTLHGEATPLWEMQAERPR